MRGDGAAGLKKQILSSKGYYRGAGPAGFEGVQTSL